MMVMHIVFGLDLIALSLGTALMVWSMKNPGKGSWLGKLFGGIVAVLSIISLVCLLSCMMRGGECHTGEGMMKGMMQYSTPADQEGHEHMGKKPERKR